MRWSFLSFICPLKLIGVISRGLGAVVLLGWAVVASGSEAPVYRFETALDGLKFQSPTQIVFAPGDAQRAFVVELGGRIAIVPDLSHPAREVFLDLSAQVGDNGPDHGALSLAFHPQYSKNGYFFVWYSLVTNGQRYNRLARFRVSAANPNRADLNSETPLITQATGFGGHDGGTILFGPDGYLYLSLGDGDEGDPEAQASHQRVDRSFFGAVIRIDVDNKPGNFTPNSHASVHPGTYSIPADNPFVDRSTVPASILLSSVRTEFWALGLRNPFRMAFDDVTGRLWCGDVGLDAREEVDLIVKGGNYGWPYREGLIANPTAPSAPPSGAPFADPIWDYDHASGLSITGGFVYRGTRLPMLSGSYLFSDFLSGNVWALQDSGARPLPASSVKLIAREAGLVNLAIDPRNGDVLAVNLFTNVIRRLTAGDKASGGKLVNLSTRAVVGTGAEVLIPSFIITGGSKKALVRAIGPGLKAYGLSGVVEKPRLTLHDSNQALMSNQGWQTSPNLAELMSTTAAIGAVPLQSGGADSAAVATLEPGGFTAVVEGADGGAGVALVEVYDADPTGASSGRLSNVAVRARVGSGESILIGGFILSDGAAREVLVRVSGPALAAYGIGPTLKKPRLALYHEQTELASNVGWNSAPNLSQVRSALETIHLPFPEGSSDCAMLVTLPPGGYTLQVSGADGGTGVALIEVFEM